MFSAQIDRDHFFDIARVYEGLEPVLPGAAVLMPLVHVERIHRDFQEVRQSPVRTSQFVGPDHQTAFFRNRTGAPVDMIVPGVQEGLDRIEPSLRKLRGRDASGDSVPA